MHLPEALTQQFRQQLADYEQENIMRYVTSVERQAREEGVLTGLQQGMQQGIQQGEAVFLLRLLNRRFGALPAEWVLRVQQASHAELGTVGRAGAGCGFAGRGVCPADALERLTKPSWRCCPTLPYYPYCLRSCA